MGGNGVEVLAAVSCVSCDLDVRHACRLTQNTAATFVLVKHG